MPPKKKTTTAGTRRVTASGKQPGQNVGAESGDRTALLGPSGSDEASETACHTCPIRVLVILESTNDVEGHEALLCEGSCNQRYPVGARGC